MKKIISLIIFLTLFSPGLFALNFGLNFEAGFLYGARHVTDVDIKNIYGNGTVYFPYAAIVWHGVILGGGYEGGYSRSGKIGLYEESTSLTVKGYEFFLGYQFKVKIFAPYFKVGYGSYSYKQTIESSFVGEYKVDHKKTTVTFGGGLKVYPLKNLYLAGEVRLVPLKVRPFEDEVDLGGLRILGGIGLSL